MKIDRLLGIVLTLLDRDTVTARELAAKFEVSARTIGRDIETLAMAGIPVGSLYGTAGGYYLMDGYKLNRHYLTEDDYRSILTALGGLSSAGAALGGAQSVLAKMRALAPPAVQGSAPIQLHFGAAAEGAAVKAAIRFLEAAVGSRTPVSFVYTDAAGRSSRRQAEPLLLTCRWYAWYLFGFCRDKQDYRLFRLSRMRGLAEAPGPFSREHPPADELLAAQVDTRRYIRIVAKSSPEWRVALEEAFPLAGFDETPAGELLLNFSVPDDERGWFGTLLSFGTSVTVLEPPSLRERLAEHARQLVRHYESEGGEQ